MLSDFSRNKNENVKEAFDRMKVLKLMRSEALKLCEKLKDTDVMGIVLVGSVATGNVHPDSDIDVCVIYRGPSPIQDHLGWTRESSSWHGFKVDILLQPLEGLEDTLIIEKARSKKTPESAKIFGWLKESRILFDPEQRIIQLKKLADRWTWDREAVISKVQEADAHLAKASERLAEGDVMGAILESREGSVDLVNAFLVKSNGMPRFIPFKLFSSLTPPTFASLFRELHGLEDLTRERVEKLIPPLLVERDRMLDRVNSRYTRVVRGEKNLLGVDTELERGIGCLKKQDFPGALLQIRSATRILGDIILSLNNEKAETHSDLLAKLKAINPEYHKMYAKIHDLERYTSPKIERLIQELEEFTRRMT